MPTPKKNYCLHMALCPILIKQGLVPLITPFDRGKTSDAKGIQRTLPDTTVLVAPEKRRLDQAWFVATPINPGNGEPRQNARMCLGCLGFAAVYFPGNDTRQHETGRIDTYKL